MTEPMLRFVSLEQNPPRKRDAAERRCDSNEIYRGFIVEEAQKQASRCSQCGVPFCSAHCPLENDIPDWLKLATTNRLEEAYARSSATNSFPEICGRICPQDRLCEGHCVIEKGFKSVTIGAVERFITENAFKEGWVKPHYPQQELGQSVGIIGAGPAGLACAERLRAEGYEVHLYERQPKAGGLLMYGIPSFKLEKNIVERRIALLEAQGIKFHLQCCVVGDDEKNSDAWDADGVEIREVISFKKLRERHDALFIATGVYRARQIEREGRDLDNIIDALDYLIAATHMPEKYDVKGKKIIVIGGGDTAMDCVRTALRQGALTATCLYRRDRENMPGSAQEVKNAEEEGGAFQWLVAPESFIGEGKVEAVNVQEMRLGAPDMNGRRAVEALDRFLRLEADMVIFALGFEAKDYPKIWDVSTLATTPWGTLKLEKGSYETSLPFVFAGGDITRGASLVVWAIRDGRDAASEIHKKLSETRVAG